MSSDRVFFVGGTGNIGAKAVQDLLANNVDVTLYARNPAKVDSLFPNRKVNVVKGDLTDLTPLKEGIKGHARLFLLISDLANLVEHKIKIAKIAYEAGVKQIVDISSQSVNFGWRTTYIGGLHYEAERRMLDIPNRGRLVTLRPDRFMLNLLTFDPWISTDDIGAVAAVVLREDIERHGDSVYSMTGDVVTPAERAKILTRVLGREFKFERVTPVQKYNIFSETGSFPAYVAYDLAAGILDNEIPHVTAGISILLGRELETLEHFIIVNKVGLNN